VYAAFDSRRGLPTVPVEHLKVTHHVHEAVSVLELRGEINGFGEDALMNAVQDLMVADQPNIVMDFSHVDYINSTGIAIIVGVLAQTRAAKVRLAATGLSEHYKEIFNITGLAGFIPCYPTASDAVAALQEK
jgi:anti-sigma B factor antagonist